MGPDSHSEICPSFIYSGLDQSLCQTEKKVFLYVGKLFHAPLISLVIILFGRLEMGQRYDSVWIHGLDANGDIFFPFYWLINFTLSAFIFLRISVVLVCLSFWSRDGLLLT